jgi:predicted Zn-dependent protease
VVALTDAQAGDARKAIENCQIALKKDPKLSKAALLQATLKNIAGQTDESEKEFVQLLKGQPDEPFLRQQLSVLYRRKSEFKRALEMIEPVARARTNDHQLQLFHLELLALSGQTSQAESALNGLKSSLGPVKFDMASSWLADVEGDFTRAVTLIELHLAERDGAIQWATLYLKNKKEPPSWLPLLKHQLTVEEWSQLAVPAERHNLWASSTYCYEQAKRLDPNNPSLLNNWAWSAMNLKEFDKEKVMDAVRRSYAAYPKNPTVLDTYAEALLRCGQYRECVDLLNANLAMTLRTPQLLLLLARAYESNNDLEKSLRTYRQVLELQSKSRDWDLRTGREALNQQIQKLELKVN